MNSLSKKIMRIQRLRALEEGKMNSLAIELAAIDVRLNALKTQRMQLEKQLEASSNLPGQARVDVHHQAMIWIEHAQANIAGLQQKIWDTESERELMLDQVVRQKTKVRGWETLQGRLDEQSASESMKAESTIADDRHLNNRLAR